jgi:hypothetical protein
MCTLISKSPERFWTTLDTPNGRGLGVLALDRPKAPVTPHVPRGLPSALCSVATLRRNSPAYGGFLFTLKGETSLRADGSLIKGNGMVSTQHEGRIARLREKGADLAPVIDTDSDSVCWIDEASQTTDAE